MVGKQSPPSRPDAGRYLRALRAATNLTQEQVAGLSGVHVRTIRGLETGRIVRPRRATVDLVARALSLDISGHMNLLEAWGLTGVGPVTPSHPPLRSQDRSELDAALARHAAEIMPILVTERMTIDANRRQMIRRTEETILALVPGVVTRSTVYDPDEAGIDLVDLHLSAVENGQVVREHIDLDRRCKIFDMSLGRSLAAGESHILRYSVDVASVRREDAPPPPMRDQVIAGFTRSPASFVLEISFAAEGPWPRRCSQIFQARPTGPVRRIGELPMSSENAVHLALLNPKPGGHGIAWQW